MPPSRPTSASSPITAAALPRHLDAGAMPACIVLAGTARWFREASLEVIVDRLLPDGDPGGAIRRVDARRPEDRDGVASALDELLTPSLFETGKVVAIDNAEAAAGRWSGKGRLSPLTALAREAAGFPAGPRALVLLTARPVKGRSAIPLKSLLKAGALIVDCRTLYDAPAPWERGRPAHDHELGRFLVARMSAAHGKRMNLEDAHTISRLIGSDLADLDGALTTLALYLGDDREWVTERDVHAAHGVTRSDPAWRLADALFDGKVTEVLDLAESAFERGLPDGRGGQVHRAEGIFAMLLGALHGSYRRVLAGAEALARGEPGDQVARDQGVPGFGADAYLARCRRDPAPLLRAHEAFLEAERGVKGGGIPHRVAMERLLLTLSRADRGSSRPVPGRP